MYHPANTPLAMLVVQSRLVPRRPKRAVPRSKLLAPRGRHIRVQQHAAPHPTILPRPEHGRHPRDLQERQQPVGGRRHASRGDQRHRYRRVHVTRRHKRVVPAPEHVLRAVLIRVGEAVGSS